VPAIVNARLHTPWEVISPGWLRVEGGRIAAMGTGVPDLPPGEQVLDVGGRVVAPGFIDLHLHGAAGWDVMDEDVGGLPAISAFLARHGCTAWLAATMTAAAPAITRRLQAIARAAQAKPHGARLLGAYVEGPFFNPQGAGAQPPEFLEHPTPQKAAALLGEARPWVKVVSLSPELPGALDTIRWLAAEGIVPALGHTWATYDETQAALAAGARHATHLYSAMRPFDKRDPGVIAAVWTDERCSAEVICDLIHAHPAALEVARKMKGPDRLVMITDAMLATGQPPGEYRLGGQPVQVDGRVALLSGSLDDPAHAVLAGSVLTQDRALGNVHRALGWSLPEALAYLSLNPARVLGLDGNRGRLYPGYEADIVVLEADLEIWGTMVGGEWVYRK